MVGTSDTDPLLLEAPPTSRRRRKRSLVWEHFTIETVSDGCTKACCKQCKQTFAYSTGKKIAGTSHLKRHITVGSCSKLRQEKKQLALLAASKTGVNSTDPPKRRYRWRSMLNFDQDRSCADLARMIIMQEYPLHIVEHTAFKTFIQGLQPQFKMPDHAAIESEISGIYQKEKQNLTQLFSTIPGRVCLSIGLWTTSQTLGYVGVTGHFIDNDWKLHSRMLNFTMVSSPHSENALSEVIGFSLSDWNLKTKLFTITLDNNCSSHDIYSANLRDHLSNKNTLTLKGQFFVVRCYAHILNVVAQDVIASIHGIVYNIRESLKYVKGSLAHEDKFTEIVQQLEIPCTGCLSLDVQSHWDTTYLMLVGALEFRHAFAYLETCDPHYNEAPSPDDWKKLEIVCTYLKLFYESANIVMGAADPTANVYFQEAWKIQLELTHATVSEDSMVRSIAKEMHEKFDKYWKDSSLVLAIAVVMDPRFKMKFVEFAFSKLYNDDATKYIKVIDDGIHGLYDEYIVQPIPLTPAYVEQPKGTNNGVAMIEASPTTTSDAVMDTTTLTNAITNSNGQAATDTAPATANSNAQAGNSLAAGDGLLDFDIYISEISVTQQTKCELDQYLEESLVPRIPEFDLLNWWRLNSLKYPLLSKMAQDVLAIPMLTVPTSSIFNIGSGSRVLDEYRSSLQPDAVEALVCSKDWLQYVPMSEAPSTAVLKLEL
uniref:Putative AC transposase n=1 Tax=Anthurium amnicola TaxID=1678845 RepID=A0A1D1ZFG6_9ARAE